MGPFVWNSNQNAPQLPPYSLYIKSGFSTTNYDSFGFDMRLWAKELLDYFHVPTWDASCQGEFGPCAWITIPACDSTDPLHIYNYGSGGVTISTSGCTWTFDDDCDLSIPGGIYFPDGTYISSVSAVSLTVTDNVTTISGITSLTFYGATVSGTSPNGDVIINFSGPAVLPTVSGGTGISGYTLGDTLYGNNSNSLSILSGNTAAVQKFMTQTGTGSVSAAPVWFDLFNTTNAWVAQKVSIEGTNLDSSYSSGVPAVYTGYGSQGSMNSGSGTIIIYDRTNVTGGFANIVSRETVIKPMSSGFGIGASTQISTASPGGGGATQEIQYTNCAGIMFSSSNTPNLNCYAPFLTVGIKELGYGIYSGYNATVPAFQMRVANNLTNALHKANIEVVVPASVAITGSVVATRYDLCTNDTTTFIQEYLRKSFTLNLQGWNVTPTANIHIGASDGSVGTAPLKFSATSILTSGGTSSSRSSTLLSTPEQGAMEVDTNGELYYSTNTTSKSRGFVEVTRYVSASTTYNITKDDYTVDCTTGSFTVTLPTAVGIQGRIYKIKNSGAGTITVATTSSQTIDGVTTKSLSTQYQVITVQSTNANWIVV